MDMGPVYSLYNENALHKKKKLCRIAVEEAK